MADRPVYEVLVDEFVALDTQCQELLTKFEDGKIIYDSIPPEGAATHAEFFEKMMVRYQQNRNHLNDILEKRNAKIQEISTAMRAQVMAGDNVVRGPDGKTASLSCGPFRVESRTYRSFEPTKLQNELQQRGLWGRFQELTTIDKDTGEVKPVMQVETKIEYKPTQNWLREQNLEEVLQNAYEEEEGTPAVTGPKPLAWLSVVDKKKGKKG
jgi:hypothetical protein